MKKKFLTKLSTFIFVLISHPVLAADDLDTRMKDWGSTFWAFGDLTMLIVGVVGVLMMLFGGWGLKKYADDSRTNPLAKPLIFFIVGGILGGITAFQELITRTLTDKDIDDDTGRTNFSSSWVN